MTIQEWLETQHRLQVEAFDVDPRALEGESLGEYVTWNATALVAELVELLQEVQWKPWANDRGKITDRDAALTEFVDIMHFLGNLALALDLDHADIAERYLGKVQVNRERQSREGGYDAVDSKCRKCGRDLTEVGLRDVVVELDGVRFESTQCAACGNEVGRFSGA